MGSRGAFVNVENGDFTFVEGGKLYRCIGVIDGIKVLVKTKGSVNAPKYSHSANRKYAIIQDDRLKYIAYYGEDHLQKEIIDLGHTHCGLKPHKHYDMDHTDPGIPITEEDRKIIRKIIKRFGLRED